MYALDGQGRIPAFVVYIESVKHGRTDAYDGKENNMKNSSGM